MNPEQQSLSSVTASQNGSLDASSRMLADSQSEHTLGGKLIGAIREHTIGKGSAQSNDQIATIAADTVSALPIVKSWVGGLVRATVLVDPTKGLTQNLSGFGLNFAEGFALNKVSSLYNPENSLSQFATAKLGTGIASEGATHLAVGFGFGIVRSGFNAQTWLDKQGNFSLATGAENVLKDGGIGAAFNLPAGLIGTRIAKASSLAMANESISPRLANAIAGAGSGYAAGGVFGGLGAVMSGQSLANVLKSANEGGVIGAVTGFGMGGLQSPKQSRESIPLTGRPSSDLTAAQPMMESVRPSSLPEAAHVSPEQVQPGTPPISDSRLFEKLAANQSKTADVPLEIQPRQYRISEVTPRLHRTDDTTGSTRYIPEGASGPWKDFNDFSPASTTRFENYRNYQVDGHSAVLSLPEAYAKQLDQVRTLRNQVEQPNAVLDALTPVQLRRLQEWANASNHASLGGFFTPEDFQVAMPVLQARVDLANHPMGNRALPEDFITLMDELPVRSNLKQLYLMDSGFWQNKWYEQHFNQPGFEAAAAAEATSGSVWFFKSDHQQPTHPQYRDQLRIHLMHEDTHLTKSDAGLYEAASQLEKGYHISEYSKNNVSEREAEDRSIGFLNLDADRFHKFVDQAPIRGAVVARDLAIQMGGKPTVQQSIYAKDYWARIKYTEERVLPKAQEQLLKTMRDGNVEDRAAAVKLLSYLGNKEHAPDLLAAAHRNADDPKLSIAALDGALRVMGVDRQAQFDTLWGLAQPGSKFTDAAIFRMRGLGTVLEEAAPAARLLELVNDGNAYGCAKQIGLMRTEEGKLAAYNYAQKLGGDRPDFLKTLAVNALRDEPQLRVSALHTLEHLDPDGLGFLMRNYFDDRNPEVNRAAREIHGRAVAKSANDLIAQGEFPAPSMIRQLGHMQDGAAAVPPLLRTAISGPASSREEALNALGGQSSNVVKFYIKQFKMNASAQDLQLLNALQVHIPGH